jgi:Transposase DDE domain
MKMQFVVLKHINMSTNCTFSTKLRKKIDSFLSRELVDEVGEKHRFNWRNDGKIETFDLVRGLLFCIASGDVSYNDWAASISLHSKIKLTKQALSERMNVKTKIVFEQILLRVLDTACGNERKTELFESFENVLIQDSTVIPLASELRSKYKGSSGRTGDFSSMRIQCVVDLKSNRFKDFSFHSFTENDVSVSANILTIAKKQDLVIRDLGYFSLESFNEMDDQGIKYLSRLKPNVLIFDQQGKPLKISKILGSRQIASTKILIGKNKIPTQLIIAKVPTAIASERIRKAKNNRDKRLNHSNEYYKTLKYTLLITNVDSKVWNPEDALSAYGIRWNIETIFKEIKSGMHLHKVVTPKYTNIYRVEIGVIAVLIFYILIRNKIAINLSLHEAEFKGKYLSIAKLLKSLMANLISIIALSEFDFSQFICSYCTYEKRYNRIILPRLFEQTFIYA